MLNDLMNLVKEFSQKTVAENSSIPADQKDVASQALATSVVDGLKSHASKGNLTDLFDIFSKKETSPNNATMSGLQSSAMDMISQKTGLNSSGIGGSLASLIPTVLGMLGNKAADPNDRGLDFNGLFSMITGGKSGGIDANAAMNRLDDDNDGFGLDDITSMVTGGKGGIMGALGGLFGGGK